MPNNFPFIQQRGMMECGITSLAMILMYYGYDDAHRLLSEEANVAKEGVNLTSLILVAEKFGFETGAYEMEYKYLLKNRLPCIAHFEGNHFIVIYKATKDQVWVADPAYGKDKYKRNDFLKKWNGVVLLLDPTETLINKKSKSAQNVIIDTKKKKALYRFFYWPVILKTKRPILEILIFSLIIQFLALVVPFFTQAIIDEVLVNHSKQLLIAILIGMISTFGLQVLLLWARNLLIVHIKVRIELDFFSRYFLHFISLRQGYYDRHKREDFINRFRENINIRQLITPKVLQQLIELVFVFFYVPVLFIYNVPLAIISTLLTVCYMGVGIFFLPKIKHLTNKSFYKELAVLGKFLDTVIGIKTVKLLSIEKVKFANWKSEYKRNLNVVSETEKAEISLSTFQSTLFYFSQIIVYWLGAYFVFNDQLSLGQYVAFISIFGIVIYSLTNASALWISLSNISISMDRLNDVLLQEREYELDDSRQTINNEISSIKISDLNFKYSKTDENLLIKKINLSFTSGQHIGIVGRNGAGKTTLVKLLAGLYTDYDGNILFNEKIELRSVHPTGLRKKIFLFPQDLYVFDTTIRENILYARPDASFNEIVLAAKKADIHEYIKSQHLGYNHRIGDFGANLSGGEKLKLGFARLFLSKPDVIIMDEASSQLDLETERKILSNVYKQFNDKIIISIAHRIHTLKHADQIIVLDKGSIVEKGTHETLIATNGLYKEFLQTYINF